MSYEPLGKMLLDYQPCRYDGSKNLFRGPQKSLVTPYVALLGGTETYGKFTECPFPELLQSQLGLQTVNLGHPNAGPDMFLHDPGVMDICYKARITVLQVPGAHNLSNRFYAVHSRRNDRFIRASRHLRQLYPEVDFTAFHYTRHLLVSLYDVCGDRFQQVQEELQRVWQDRMAQLCCSLGGNIVLLWLSDHPVAAGGRQGIRGADPLFVTQQMMSKIFPYVADVTEVVIDHDDWANGRSGLVFNEFEEPAAREMLGVIAHQKASQALCESLWQLLQ